MSDNDDDIKFRDQCAMKVMQVCLQSNWDDKPLIDGSAYDSDHHDHIPGSQDRVLRKIAIFSYKVADIMRKARIGAFD